MNSIQNDIDYSQRNAIGKKAKELGDITIQHVKRFSGFSAFIKDSVFTNLSSDEIKDLVNDGHFDTMKHLKHKQQEDIMLELETKLSISSSNPASTAYLKNIGSIICGISPSRIDDLVPGGDLEEFKSNWTNKCLVEAYTDKTKHNKECAMKSGLSAQGYCKIHPQVHHMHRKETIINYQATRTEAQGLSQLTDELSLVVSASIDGLTISEIDSIPNSVLLDSLNKISGNERLTKWQKHRILQKLIDAGHDITTKEGLELLGNIATAVDMESVDASQFDTLIKERPSLMRQLSKSQKISLYTKLSNDLNPTDLLASGTSLSRYIPSSVIKAVTTVDFNVVSKMKWTRSQALVLLDKYKQDNDVSVLGLNDVKNLGTVTIGLSCQNVEMFELHDIIDLSRAVDEAIGNNIPSDLANCLSTKVNLCLKMKCFCSSADVNEIIGEELPGNLLLFMSPDVLASVAYTRHCTSMIRRLGEANIKLIPPGVGHLTMEGIVQVSHICYNKNEIGHKPPSEDSNTDILNNVNSNQNIPSIDNLPDKLPGNINRFRRNNPDSKENSGNSNPVKGTEIQALGKFACFLKKYNSSVFGDSMAKVSELLPACLHWMDEHTKNDLNVMFENEIEKFATDQEERLSSLGPLFPLIKPSILKTLSNDLVAHVLEGVPSNIYNLGNSLEDNNSTTTLNFQNNLLISFPDEPKSFAVKPIPIDMRAFADAVFPKLLEYMSSNNNADADSNLYETLLRAGPSVIALSSAKIAEMSNTSFRNSLNILGEQTGWNSDQLQEIKSQAQTHYGDISSWSNELLQQLKNLAVFFTLDEINDLTNLDKNSVEVLSYVNWPSLDFQTAIFNKYLELNTKTVADLEGDELVILGDLLCGISVDDISTIDNTAMKFSAYYVGKVKCFTEDRRLQFKNKILSAYDDEIDPSILCNLGVLAGQLSSQDLSSVIPQHVAFLSADALRIIPFGNIQGIWNSSHYALLGPENGAILMLRPNIFKTFDAQIKNTLFRTAFGNNAGLVASQIQLLTKGKSNLENAYNVNEKKLIKTTSMLFGIMQSGSISHTVGGGFNMVYMLDPTLFIPPPLPDFAEGLSKDDFSATFEASFLEERKIINFINGVSGTHSNILNVMKGEANINDLGDDDIKHMPAKIWQGLKDSQIGAMSKETIGSLLDSDKAARDPVTMMAVLNKMDETVFSNAIADMNQKVQDSLDSEVPWRPPICTQQVIIRNFLKELRSNQLSDTQALDKFIESICSFVAGMKPGNIRKLPMVEEKKVEVLECMGKSYLDLSINQKKQIVKWATTNIKDEDVPKLDEYGMFILDLSPKIVRKALTPEMALEIVESGKFAVLDNLHRNYKKFSKQLINVLVKSDKTKFDESEFLQKLAHAQCDIPMKKLRSTISKSSASYLASYTINNCKSDKELIQDNLQQCDEEVSLRLQRCELYNDRKQSSFGFSFGSFSFNLPVPSFSTDTFQMVTQLADTLLADKDLNTIDGSGIMEISGALGGINPTEMEKLPSESVLNALPTIKNNSNLSDKHRKIMLKKVMDAGLDMNDLNSLSNLGELVSAVSAETFRSLSPENIKNNIEELRKKANAFTPGQRKSIVLQLEQSNIEEVLKDDLGDLCKELSLSKLDTMQEVNLTLVKDQPWNKPQAEKLVQIHFNSSDEVDMTSDLVGDLGPAANGLKCSNFMDLELDDVYESLSTIDTLIDAPADMDQCIFSKFHFVNQVEHGSDYMDGSDIEESALESILETVPSDVAMFYEPEEVNKVPDSLCKVIYEKIGEANLNSLFGNPGSARRMKHAQYALDCLKRSSESTYNGLQEEEVITLGNLICDLPASAFAEMTDDGFFASLDFIKNCIHRLTKDHVTELLNLINTHMGPTSDWDDITLSALGYLVGFLTPDDINQIDNEYFADIFHDMIPPTLDESYEATDILNVGKDAILGKGVEAVFQNNHEANRRKRQDATPTYVDIASLGQGNSKWTVDELKRISNEDLLSSMDILGAVEDWTTEQRSALLEAYEGALGRTLNSWTANEIKDAMYILTDLTEAQIAELNLSTIAAAGSLSKLPWSNLKKKSAVENYLQRNSKTTSTMTAEDIAGVGDLMCGLESTDMTNIQTGVVSQALKNLGESLCYNQDQLDALYELVRSSNNDEDPDGATITQMGTLSAGMEIKDLTAVTEDNMPSFTTSAISLMPGERFREGMTANKLAAAGSTNIAAIIDRESLFNALSVEQRNVLRVAAYGSDAEIEDENATSIANEGTTTNAVSERSDAAVTTKTTLSTTTAGGMYIKSCPCLIIFYLFIIFVLR